MHNISRSSGPADRTNVPAKSALDRVFSLVSDVRPGEGTTAVLMLLNIFLLLICYAIIKTVREPLILLGGGAEVRSYAAAGQALLLIATVPLYGWVASRVSRVKLVIGVTVFFVLCIEAFAAAVVLRVPYVGVAFFIWVGIFNISLVAQFWSYANDIYSQESGARLFPIIVVGMTAGAPLGSLLAARLFHLGLRPELILQLSAALLAVSAGLYLAINRREGRRSPSPVAALDRTGGFQLVLRSRQLRLVALLVVLLNVVNTTGEYLMARLLTEHVGALAHADPAFNRQAFIGAFAGTYQFWVNVTALVLQALVTSRLVKYTGLRGVLMALPLIALGGYSIIAAGVSFSAMRWIKTLENATDYSVMNTARQMLWLDTSRVEKYKAKQAIDTFFVRGGDVLSAGLVLAGTSLLHLRVDQFAAVNVVFTLAWLAVAVRLSGSAFAVKRRHLVPAAVAAALIVTAVPASAQDTRQAVLAGEQAVKAQDLHPYEPDPLERKVAWVKSRLLSPRRVYASFGSVIEGTGLAVGPGYRRRVGSGALDVHAAWSVTNARGAAANLRLPALGNGRLTFSMLGRWREAPRVARFGTVTDPQAATRTNFAYADTTLGVSARATMTRAFAVEGGLDTLAISTATLDPTYRRSRLSAVFDWRMPRGLGRRGGRYRLDWSDYRQANGTTASFGRLDAEAVQLVPLLRENWILAFRTLASTTTTAAGAEVPFFLLPDLGGDNTLRGYPTWRLRGRNRALVSGEYRWTAGPFADMALFIDAGTVADRFGDLGSERWARSYGLSLSFHSFEQTAFRLTLARTREGQSLLLGFSPTF